MFKLKSKSNFYILQELRRKMKLQIRLRLGETCSMKCILYGSKHIPLTSQNRFGRWPSLKNNALQLLEKLLTSGTCMVSVCCSRTKDNFYCMCNLWVCRYIHTYIWRYVYVCVCIYLCKKKVTYRGCKNESVVVPVWSQYALFFLQENVSIRWSAGVALGTCECHPSCVFSSLSLALIHTRESNSLKSKQQQ